MNGMKETVVYPVIDYTATGKNIMELRLQHGMSVREMQEIFGFTSPQPIYKWQWGKTLPDISNLLLMSSLWNIPVEKILVLEHRELPVS